MSAKLLLALTVTLVLSACGGATPINSEGAANGFSADFIGEVDGCRIWRINDRHTAYFARCPEGPADTSTTYYQPCGKGCMTRKLTSLFTASIALPKPSGAP